MPQASFTRIPEGIEVPEKWTPAFAGVTSEGTGEGRLGDVRRALDTVLDPELDEPVTALGFVRRVSVEGDDVSIDFRLPTYWCSPNFAWIMAEDMHAALRTLPWARHVRVTLADHLFAGKINAAVNRGDGFGEAFADAGGDLARLRATFRRKAYLGRMAALIDTLRVDGRTDTDLMATTVGDLRARLATADAGPTSPLRGGRNAEGISGGGLDIANNESPLPKSAIPRINSGVVERRPRHTGEAGVAPVAPERTDEKEGADPPSQIARYLELRAAFGGPHGDGDPAFRTPEGGDIAPAALPLFLRGIRMTQRGVEANGEMCRIYLRERPAATSPGAPAPGAPG